MSSETRIFKALKETAVKSTSNGNLKNLLVLLVGAGIAWGMMKMQVSELVADSDENKEQHSEYRKDIRGISDRLSRIEGKLEIALAKK